MQISDTHLSPKHGWFHANWRAVLDRINQANPQLVVNSGDLSINGAEDDADLTFAFAEHRRITLPWRAVPGNHDIGEEPQAIHLGQPINSQNVERYRAHQVVDRWMERVAGWRIIGVNSQLTNTGLADEQDQLDWLTDGLESGDDPVGIFLHKPLFLDDPDDDVVDAACVLPGPRRQLLDLFLRTPVRFVASGHLHEARVQNWEGISLVWCPSTAFPATEPRSGERTPLGWVEHHLDGDRHDALVVADERLERYDLDTLKEHGRYSFLYQTPACPPALV